MEYIMFRIFKRPSDALFIDRNRVFCPVRRADTDVEICASCRWLVDVNLSAEPGVLHCRPIRGASLGEIPYPGVRGG
jgi:hypothetical protein